MNLGRFVSSDASSVIEMSVKPDLLSNKRLKGEETSQMPSAMKKI
jgi:hypothetical protein